MSPKHIVIDARIRPSSTGRPIARLLEYLPQLDSVNRYTVLLAPTDDWRPTAPNFTAIVCPYKRFSFNPLDQISYGRFLKKLKPDLVFFGQTPQEPIFFRGKRVTLTHDLTMLRFTRPGRYPRWIHWIRMQGYKLTFWTSHRQAAAITVPTKFVADDLAQLHPFAKPKITVTLEATEPPLTAKPVPIAGVNKPFLFHVGSPFPHKNIERLVAAFEKLSVDHPNLRLVLAGKKEQYFEKLQKQIDASPVSERIVVPGFVSDGELKWLYENAEAYVLPALSEGFGLPGLEAMAHGCPLVSSNATCLPEVYGDAAHFFDPLSVDDMAAKISEALADPALRNNLKAKGLEQVKKYSWQRFTAETLAVWQRVLNG